MEDEKILREKRLLSFNPNYLLGRIIRIELVSKTGEAIKEPIIAFVERAAEFAIECSYRYPSSHEESEEDADIKKEYIAAKRIFHPCNLENREDNKDDIPPFTVDGKTFDPIYYRIEILDLE